MSKQFHYVVHWDTETGQLEIDVDSAWARFEDSEGTIFNTESSEWEPATGNSDYLEIEEKLASKLREIQISLH